MSLELFNVHQQDVRARSDSLIKAIFVLSGGALSISVGIFTNTPNIPECIQSALQFSWWSLTICILSLVMALFIMIVRDYHFGEKWRDQLDGKIESASDRHPVADVLMWIFGIIGLISFSVGFITLAYSATSMLSNA